MYSEPYLRVRYESGLILWSFLSDIDFLFFACFEKCLYLGIIFAASGDGNPPSSQPEEMSEKKINIISREENPPPHFHILFSIKGTGFGE